MKPSFTIKLVAIGLAFGLAACANMAPPPAPPPPVAAAPPPPPTLYQQLGGQPAIVAVVDRLVDNVAHDRRINRYFARANIPRLKQGLVDQVCQATGGPCVYQGPPMRVVHHRMHVTKRAFNALVEDLVRAMDSLNVPKPLQQQLLGILGPLEVDIVNV
ncbi:MAG TPA: group 1 truncated hemoglobin [Stellaceae bacterium]|jgi:hemoglobin|nr:group 1 truncated hemoglobin [Stellaceae bacterium]